MTGQAFGTRRLSNGFCLIDVRTRAYLLDGRLENDGSRILLEVPE